MTGKSKDARPTAATVKRAAEPGTNNHESPESSLNCTISGGGGQIQISDFLSRGQENAIPGKHLRQMIGLSDRDLRRMIETERRSGTPILSDNQHGYFLPNSPAEVELFVRSMNHRADEIRSVAAAVERAGV